MMANMDQHIKWIAVDWGTTHLRAWALGNDNKILHHSTSEKGMGSLASNEFEPALLELIQTWLSPNQATPIIACGMVGSRQGWQEAPYQTTPCTPLSSKKLVKINSQDDRLSVWIVPGIKQNKPADVMRGEETQTQGYLTRHPGFEGVMCLPGTHTKWVNISAGEIIHFQTFMTGEIFNLLSKYSILRHSIGCAEWDESAFSEAVIETIACPQEISAKLFSLRAEGLINGLGADSARARLSGLLIGVELAATRELWCNQDTAIIGASKLAQIYANALSLMDKTVTLSNADEMVLSGLSAAHNLLPEAML
jgi:2-dehydro-3-deoxygalactonokinase